MKFKNLVIESFAYAISDQEMTSEMIESSLSPLYKKLKLPEGRLELMTGIKSRRVWAAGTKPSDLSTLAAEKLFLKSKIPKADVDLLIHASVCRDFLEPATASVVHANLGLSKVTSSVARISLCDISSGLDKAADYAGLRGSGRAKPPSGVHRLRPCLDQTQAIVSPAR